MLNEYKDFRFEDEYKKELMIFCAEFGDCSYMESLFKAFEVQDNESFLDESLHFAIKSNQEEMVKFLISKKADINSRVVNSDMLPMELAIKSGHTNILEILQKEPKLDWDQFQKNQKDSNAQWGGIR